MKTYKMKVKIEKSSETFFWYSSKIGECFEVYTVNTSWLEVNEGPKKGMRILKSDVSFVQNSKNNKDETIRIKPNFHPKKQKQKTNGMIVLLFMIFVTQLSIIGTGIWYATKETERDNKDERIQQQYMEILYLERVNHHIFRKCKECDVSDYWFKNENK